MTHPLLTTDTVAAERLLRHGVTLGPHTVQVWYTRRKSWRWKLRDGIGILAIGYEPTMHSALSMAESVSRTLAVGAWRAIDARGGLP